MNRSGVYLWRGQTYIGQKAVAEAAGITQTTVSYHLNTHGHLDLLGTGTERSKQSNKRPLSVGPREYSSISEFAREVGLPWSTAHKWASTGRADALLAAAEKAVAPKGSA